MRRLKAPDSQVFLFRWLTDDERRYAKLGLNQAVNLVRPKRICTRGCVMDQGVQQPAEELLNAKEPRTDVTSQDPGRQLRLKTSCSGEAAASQPGDSDRVLKT